MHGSKKKRPTYLCYVDSSRKHWHLKKHEHTTQHSEKQSLINDEEIVMSGNKAIEIKLLCPSLSKMTQQLVTCEEQRIDLGSIARAFGLEPSTLRLNGYFISRGIDLISSSLTWNSLLSFFSSKGLSTGKDNCDALLVTGKLCKVGNKRRGHDSQDFQNGVGKVMEGEHGCSSCGNRPEAMNFLKKIKLRESNSGEILNGISCKRKPLFEDFILFKKFKTNEDQTDIQDEVNDLSGNISCSQFTCSYASKNLKRTREDEAIVADHKRIR